MEVFKFGGASVKDAEGVRNVGVILKRLEGEKLLIVVSAMAKTTNSLEKLVNSFIQKDENSIQLFNDIKNWHISLLNELINDSNNPAFEQIENLFVELDWILEEEPHDDFDFVYDQIVSFGELFSTCIVAAYLKSIGLPVFWLDARNCIKTDNSYREAIVDWKETQEAVNLIKADLDKNLIPLTQGFIGGTSENYTTTLGREGSDYTAAIFANCLDADSMTIWKDVDGVFSADPKQFSGLEGGFKPHLFTKLSYIEAIEMTYFGATVIHPKTIKPLQNKSIPLLVKPFLKPEQAGTYIGIIEENVKYDPSVIIKQNQLLISISSKDASFIAEDHLHVIFGIFASNQVRINLMQNAALSFSVSFDNDDNRRPKLLKALEEKFSIRYNDGLRLITIRHYSEPLIIELLKGTKLFLEQRSRNVVQLLVK